MIVLPQASRQPRARYPCQIQKPGQQSRLSRSLYPSWHRVEESSIIVRINEHPSTRDHSPPRQSFAKLWRPITPQHRVVFQPGTGLLSYKGGEARRAISLFPPLLSQSSTHHYGFSSRAQQAGGRNPCRDAGWRRVQITQGQCSIGANLSIRLAISVGRVPYLLEVLAICWHGGIWYVFYS